MAKRIYTAWYTPCFLFFAFHYLLWACLDRSDIPGAAGTLHLYEAMRGSDKIYEMSSIYQWAIRQGYSYSFAMWSTSFAGVFLGFWGGMLGAWAYDGKKGVRSLAWILLFWPPIHLYGWLIGVDSLVFGLSFLGAGLIWAAMRLRFWGLLLIPVGGVLLSISLSFKLITAPILLCVVLAPVAIREWNRWHVLLVMLMCATLAAAMPELSSDGQLQGGLRIPEVDWLPVAMGWDRLRGMPAMGMPEGKWDQLIMLCVLAGVLSRGTWGVRTLGSVCASLIVVVSAFVLEDRLGTRLLAPASFGVLVMLSSLFRTWVYFLPVVVGGLGLEMWAFVDQFQERRASWANTRPLNIPRAPSLWRAQYPENPTIFKGLSLYGAAQAREQIEKTTAPMVYSMRLRDGRENSLFVYAYLAGKETRTLDVQHCCTRSADEKCAKEVVAAIGKKGGLVLVPTEIENWERVYANEKRWNRALLRAIQTEKSFKSMSSWGIVEGFAGQTTSDWPCSSKGAKQ